MNRMRNAFVLRSGIAVLAWLIAGTALGQDQPELSYAEYRVLAWAADRLDHVTKFEPLTGEAGMLIALGERFGTVQVYRTTPQGVQREWKSPYLSGVPEELLVADLDGDGFDDSLLCRTNGGMVYVWNLDDYTQAWESLPGEYQTITCFTVANVDAGVEAEIVLLGDNKIAYVDGVTFAKEFTSINDYEASAVRCGDVDGDGRVEVVLNSGQVIDSATGEVEWDDEPFFSRIELLDIDGDGTPEIFTENEAGGLLKVFNVGYRSEVRFQ